MSNCEIKIWQWNNSNSKVLSLQGDFLICSSYMYAVVIYKMIASEMGNYCSFTFKCLLYEMSFAQRFFERGMFLKLLFPWAWFLEHETAFKMVLLKSHNVHGSYVVHKMKHVTHAHITIKYLTYKYLLCRNPENDGVFVLHAQKGMKNVKS